MPTCPNCHHTWGTPAKVNGAKFRPEDRDTSQMSDEQVRKYFAARALWDDCAFHMARGGPLVLAWERLQARIEHDGPKAEHKAERDALRLQWRVARAQAAGWGGAPSRAGYWKGQADATNHSAWVPL